MAARPAVNNALHDITERKQTGPRSEERYRRIVEAAQEGIWMCDADGRTQFANRRMAEMLGYTAKELQGRAVYEFFHPGHERRQPAITF